MKKIITTILGVATALFALSSCEQVDKTFVDSSKAVAPVILSSSTSNGLSATYKPGELVVNGKAVDSTLVRHFFAAVMIDETAVNVTIASKDVDSTNTVTASAATLSSLLLSRGYEYGKSAKVKFVLRAGMSSAANTGYVDSETTIEATIKLKKNAGGAYATFTEDSPWSVIGSIASTGNNWNADEAMMSDGTWHVCEGLVLTTKDQFKFRKDGAWGTNFGAGPGISTEPYVVTIGEEQPAGANGKNLAVPEDGVYDLLLNPEAGLYKIVVHKEDPLAAYTEDSPWSVIGSIASTGNEWNSDEEMTSNGTWHVCRAIELTTKDQFKFRKDGAWGTNLGAGPEISTEPYVVTLGEEQPAGPNGKNLAVPEDGTYNLFLDPEAKLYRIEKVQ